MATQAQQQSKTQKTPGRNNGGPDANRDADFEKLNRELAKAPEGYEDAATDVEKFWDPKLSPIHCSPISVKLFDSQLDEGKPSALIAVRLLADCAVQTREKGASPEIARRGEIVGVWYKAGMRGIKSLAGVPVYMRIKGTKDTGKPSAMVVYELKSKGAGKELPISEDTRDQSKHVRTSFDPAGAPSETPF
jgi:hypothetical protein